MEIELEIENDAHIIEFRISSVNFFFRVIQIVFRSGNNNLTGTKESDQFNQHFSYSLQFSWSWLIAGRNCLDIVRTKKKKIIKRGTGFSVLAQRAVQFIIFLSFFIYFDLFPSEPWAKNLTIYQNCSATKRNIEYIFGKKQQQQTLHTIRGKKMNQG